MAKTFDLGRVVGPMGPAGQAIVDQNTGERVCVWYGTLAEYNALPEIHAAWEYNILEEEIG